MVITSTSVVTSVVVAGSIVAVVAEGSMVISSTSVVTAGSIVAVVAEGSMVISSTSVVTAGSIVAVEKMTVSILLGP